MSTTTSTDFGSILNAAIQGGYVADLAGGTYTITSPIVIHITQTTQGPMGIDGGGATLISQVTNGQPLIQIVVDPGVDARYLNLSNFTIQGNGREGDGIQLLADGNDRWLYNYTINNVTVSHVGGYGLDIQGSIFEGITSNSWMIGDAKGGAYYSHTAGGGQVSALRWFGGGFQDNGGAGLTLDNGARDISVDGVSFINNGGGGISAGNGITSVASSTFVDNHGPAVWVQNYGNFNDNTFTSSGAQTIGITGWLNGGAILTGNTATGSSLANLQGYGSAFVSGDTGQIVTGSNIAVSGDGGGNATHVTVDTHGVAAPALSGVTAATTAAVANSTGTGPLETALDAAIAGGTVAHLTNNTYTVTAPIIVHVTSSTQGPIGIDLGGAKIISQIAGGGPVIEIIVDPGVNVGTLTLANFLIQGSGYEGDGIKIVADGTDRSIQNLNISGVNVEHVGGIGLDVIGNVHGTVFDSWMHGDAQGGARFANSAGGGVASGLSWIGGGFRKNGVAGLILDNGAHDMTVKGAYFVENNGPGINATSGITLVKESGFENNQGAGAMVGGSGGSFISDTFSTWGPQGAAVAGQLTGGQINMNGTDAEYYGSGSNTTVLANVQGSGTLAVVGGGSVVAGPNVAVTGGHAFISQPPASAPVLTEKLASDTGASASDKITSNPALTGTADPGAIVHFTVDGSAVAATATANSSGAWSFTPTGLADGAHTVVVSETNAAGQTGSASLAFTLDTKAPVVTEKLVNGGTTAATAALTGTGDAGAVVHFTVDGSAIAGTTTADATGAWSYTPAGLAAGSHTVVASETDAAGNTGSASLTFTLSTSAPPPPPSSTAPLVTAALASDTGASATDKITSNSALSGTADAGAVVHFTVDGAAVAATATANSSGAWAFTPTGLANGSLTIVASETNAGGNTGSASLAFTLDTQAPVPVFSGGTLANGQVTLTGTTGSAGDSVSIYDGNSWLGFATTGANGSFTYTAAADTSVSHSYGMNATDLAGNEGHGSTPLVLSPGSTVPPPAPVVTEKLVSDTGASATDKITSNAALSGTADAGAVVHFTVDGAAVAATATANSSGAWSFTPTGLADGNHTVVASETNAAGQTGSASLAFTLDTKAPLVTEKLAGGGTTAATPALTGTGDAGAVVHFTVDGSAIAGSTTADATGAWSYTPTGLADGQHTVVASETDTAGNTGSASLSFMLSTAKIPVVTTGLLSDSGASATDRITANPALSGTADPNAVVHFTVDGAAVAATATANSTGAWSFTPTGLADGAHTVVASETNTAGTGTASLSFTLDTKAPVVTEKLVSGGTTTANPALTGTGDAGAVVHFTVDGSAIAGTATADATGAWSYTPTGLADGQHTVVASETDTAGNSGSASLSFMLSTAKVPVVTAGLANDTGASATDRITANLALAGTADPNAVVHFTVDGAAIAATATANASGAWAFTPSGLADGAHTIVASETNAAGTGTGSLSFTLDTHAPAPVFTGGTLANGQVSLTGTTGGAGDTVSIYDGNSWLGFATTGSNGNFNFTAAADSTITHSYWMNATDLAGNEGHSSSPLVLSSSTVTPPVSVPVLTEKLVSDSGASATDKITANPALTGTADPNAVVHFTVDGSAIAATATANASGAWSFTPTGLTDGQHTIVASETNAGGATGTASLSFTLDTHAPVPVFTGGVQANGQMTLTGTTGGANDTVSIYDGNSWLGFATTGSDGSFSFTAKAPSNTVHSYGANATDLAGSEGHGSNNLILGRATADILTGGSGNDVIIGNGGNDKITGGAGADTLTGGSGQVTFTYNAAAESTASASDKITDFQHGSDKIDFTNIAGIGATNGVPTFQGNITGTGNLTLSAHSVAYVEVGGNTQVLVNTTGMAETVTTSDMHSADMKITLVGVNLGLTGTDFHHA